MSTIGGGAGGSPEFDKLIQLATFVQGTGYLERVKELQALETSSKEALDKANAAIAEAKVAQDALDKREVKIKQREDALEAAKQNHARKVNGLAQALRDFG